ncbi:uncharacterized protein O3C94_005962 [Discoglossus pictus]
MLESHQRDLYREVMRDNYETLLSLGYSLDKPDLVSRIEQGQLDLWDSRLTVSRRHYNFEDDDQCFLDKDIKGIHFRDMQKTEGLACAASNGSTPRSSHLGALMRLVNEIPGFLLGSSVTDGSPSPARSLEEQSEHVSPSPKVKAEERSQTCTPVSAPCLRETQEIVSRTANPATMERLEQSPRVVVLKAEEVELSIDTTPKMMVPIRPHQGMIYDTKTVTSGHSSASDTCKAMKIKQEKSPPCSPAHSLTGRWKESPMQRSISPPATRNPSQSPGSRGSRTPETGNRRTYAEAMGLSPRMAVPLSRNPSISPSSSLDTSVGIKRGEPVRIKQEDCGSEDHPLLQPVNVRRQPSHPAVPLYQDNVNRRQATSARRSPADNIPLGNSHLHGLVNCLKEISTTRPRPYSTFFTAAPVLPTRSAELDRICTEASVRDHVALASRGMEVAPVQPNPFTVAVTSGASRQSSTEHRMADPRGLRLCKNEDHRGSLPALGKCLEKMPAQIASPHRTGIRISQGSEEVRRPDLGMKRAHSDDLSQSASHLPGLKRQALETSSPSRAVTSCSPRHSDRWRSPEERPRPHTDDVPVGKSHLMSVMNCVRKIPSCRPSPPAMSHCSSVKMVTASQDMPVRETDHSRASIQGGRYKECTLRVKEEKDPSPPRPLLNVWVQPPSTPEELKGPGSTKNVHLSGLMKLMEEIPVTDSNSSSRAMFSIAVGHSDTRRMDRTNHLQHRSDDGFFHPELNDNTIASVDSMFSDDTSLSSENVDPLYSAIGGMQKVVSDVADLGSSSPLTVIARPPVTASPAANSIQDGNKRSKESSVGSSPQGPSPCPSRVNNHLRSGLRSAPVSEARTCSAENGEASFAALCGLQKVVRGFSEQECVSPLSAIRSQENPARKKSEQEEQGQSTRMKDTSPSLRGPFLCDDGNWPSGNDSSYSALSGLQKVVNGFSDIGCVSPFSAVSTTTSEGAMEATNRRRSERCGTDCEDLPQSGASFLTHEDWPAEKVDSSYSAITGLQQVVNGVPDIGSLSPITVVSIPSSDGGQEPSVKRRYEEDIRLVSPRPVSERPSQSTQTMTVTPDSGSHKGPVKKPSNRSMCIDLTEEEEQVPDKDIGVTLRRREQRPLRKVADPPKPTASGSQCIDLTEDDEPPVKAKALTPEAGGKRLSHSVSTRKPHVEKRPSRTTDPTRVCRMDRPLDPRQSGQERNPGRQGAPAVNEHLSGLEKLLKDMPAFGSRHPSNSPHSNAHGQSVSWWFKSTSPHET